MITKCLRLLTLLIVLSSVAGAAVSIVTTTLPDVLAGIPYSVQLVATGGVLPYTWTLSGGGTLASKGAACTGLTLSSSGLISGTPTTSGTCSFTAVVTESAVVLPTVAITAPSAGNVSGSSVTVTATCTSANGVAGVSFYYYRQATGLKIIGVEDVVSPYTVSWNTTLIPNGTYSLTAVCRDTAGNTNTSSPVSVTNISGPPPPTSLSGVVQ